MIKNYNSFFDIPIFEANVKNKVKRSDLKVGDLIMTQGEFDGVLMEYQTGKILAMKEYGNILVEFDESFNSKLHAGFRDVGKKKRCFYIPIENIASNNKEEYEKIIKKIGDEKRNRQARLNTDYKEGDIFVGVGRIKQYGNLNIDGEMGIVYYTQGNGGLDYNEKSPGNIMYWVGFLDKFDNRYMWGDYEGIPPNGAGLTLDKLYMRHATPEEIEKMQDKLNPFIKQIEQLKKSFKEGDVVVGVGKNNQGYNDFNYEGQIGLIRQIQGGGGRGRKQYVIQFLKQFSQYLYDVNYVMGGPYGYILGAGFLREPTEKELADNQTAINSLKEEIEDYLHDYKVGDYILTHGVEAGTGMQLDGQIGIIRNIVGVKPQEQFDVEFLAKFDQRLYKLGKYENGYRVYRRNMTIPKGIDIEELKRKLDAREIAPFICSPTLSMLLSRTEIKIKAAFGQNSYFDVMRDSNDMISYMPIKRWDGKEDIYKSRFRQQVKLGKFLRMLNKDLTDKDVENGVNAYKAAYDIVVKGTSDKLRLVAGEAMRFWYCGENYAKGGGTLNSSCMQAKSKGPEMQMFVDNPDVIQMLILTDENNKLLGRANVWRLAVPEGKTYMEYVYARHDKDVALFVVYANERGWYTADSGRSGYGRGGGNVPGNMICALTSGKKYKMGKDALDHFDTFMLSQDGTYLYRGNSNWKRPDNLKIAHEDEVKIDEPLKNGDKIIYKNPGNENDGKEGTYYGTKLNGKIKVLFDDGSKLACNKKNIHKFKEE